MPRKSKLIIAAQGGKIVDVPLPIQMILAGIEAAQMGLQALYRRGKPEEFAILEALVDCNNHLHKALEIATSKLAQLHLPEPCSPEQPKLPATGEDPRD